MAKHKPKGTEDTHSPEEVIPSNIARFGPSLCLKGELSGKEDLVIDGKFQGKINLENNNVLVREGGNVKADIRVNSISIRGNVKGNIYASGKVFISAEGQLQGDINAPTISIMDGARFKGSVIMDKIAKSVFPPEKEPELQFSKEVVEEPKETEKGEDIEDNTSPKFRDL
jgi:cytoskeletal protein CcmA (bactofilin family)